jgi:hypothetical protein
MQSLGMLDAILEADWEYRYYSFNAKWSDTEQMGSMRNGSGDDFFAVFGPVGCFLRGFDHESAMTPWRETPPSVWRGVLDGVPAAFESSLREPAFHMEDTTFCIWWSSGDSAWSRGSIEFPKGETDPDGSQWMLSALDGDPRTYQTFAKEYFELDVELDAISRIYAHEPLSRDLMLAFPASRSFEEVAADAEEIGYPVKR